jgi:hypothetical protein
MNYNELKYGAGYFMIGAGITGVIFGLYLVYLGRNYNIYKISDNYCLDCNHYNNDINKVD